MFFEDQKQQQIPNNLIFFDILFALNSPEIASCRDVLLRLIFCYGLVKFAIAQRRGDNGEKQKCSITKQNTAKALLSTDGVSCCSCP